MLIPHELRSPDHWAAYLKDHSHGFFITLNTNRHLPNGLTPRVKDELLALDRPTQHIISDLRRFCLGRHCNALKGSIRSVAAYEVGTKSGLLHVHILFAHDGCVERSGDAIANRLRNDCPARTFGKWSFTSDIDVKALGNVATRLEYMHKQTGEIAFATDEYNIHTF